MIISNYACLWAGARSLSLVRINVDRISLLDYKATNEITRKIVLKYKETLGVSLSMFCIVNWLSLTIVIVHVRKLKPSIVVIINVKQIKNYQLKS